MWKYSKVCFIWMQLFFSLLILIFKLFLWEVVFIMLNILIFFKSWCLFRLGIFVRDWVAKYYTFSFHLFLCFSSFCSLKGVQYQNNRHVFSNSLLSIILCCILQNCSNLFLTLSNQFNPNSKDPSKFHPITHNWSYFIPF